MSNPSLYCNHSLCCVVARKRNALNFLPRPARPAAWQAEWAPFIRALCRLYAGHFFARSPRNTATAAIRPTLACPAYSRLKPRQRRWVIGIDKPRLGKHHLDHPQIRQPAAYAAPATGQIARHSRQRSNPQ